MRPKSSRGDNVLADNVEFVSESLEQRVAGADAASRIASGEE
jgi:hypothetical protein